MAEEAELGSHALERLEALLRVEHRLNVVEGFRLVEGAMRHRAIRVGQRQRQIDDPLFLFVGELFTRPDRRGLGVGVEAVDRDFAHRRPVVVARDHIAVERADGLQAFGRFGTVADDVTEADNLVDLLRTDGSKHHVECFGIAVDVTEECVTHEGSP